MMGIIVSKTCLAYKKYNKIISGFELAFLFFSYHNDALSSKHQIRYYVSVIIAVLRCRHVSSLKFVTELP